MEYDRIIEGIKGKYALELGDWHSGGKICFKINNQYEICMARSPYESAFFLSAPIYQLTPNTSREFYRNLLAYNLYGNKTGNGFLSLDTSTDTVILMEKFDEEEGDFILFDKKLKQFLTTLIDLKKRISMLEFHLPAKKRSLETPGQKI